MHLSDSHIPNALKLSRHLSIDYPLPLIGLHCYFFLFFFNQLCITLDYVHCLG
ncbi:hypothetical protein BY458DRAFT_516551 [Sporodiniella umbellata]|nr:hypothetical protein BY458DRAFT_516551 [Sporodiniella umbellata]